MHREKSNAAWITFFINIKRKQCVCAKLKNAHCIKNTVTNKVFLCFFLYLPTCGSQSANHSLQCQSLALCMPIIQPFCGTETKSITEKKKTLPVNIIPAAIMFPSKHILQNKLLVCKCNLCQTGLKCKAGCLSSTVRGRLYAQT